MLTLRERVWRKVKKGPGCWEWQGGGSDGYGRITVHEDGKPDERLAVHRLTYEWTYGPIPEGLHIDHLCKNKACCRPSHLEAVSNQENIRRIHQDNGHDQLDFWQPEPEPDQLSLWNGSLHLRPKRPKKKRKR